MACVVCRMDVPAELEEGVDGLWVESKGSSMEGGVPPLVRGVDVCAEMDEGADDVWMGVCSSMEGRSTVGRRGDVDVDAKVEDCVGERLGVGEGGCGRGGRDQGVEEGGGGRGERGEGGGGEGGDCRGEGGEGKVRGGDSRRDRLWERRHVVRRGESEMEMTDDVSDVSLLTN